MVEGDGAVEGQAQKDKAVFLDCCEGKEVQEKISESIRKQEAMQHDDPFEDQKFKEFLDAKWESFWENPCIKFVCKKMYKAQREFWVSIEDVFNIVKTKENSPIEPKYFGRVNHCVIPDTKGQFKYCYFTKDTNYHRGVRKICLNKKKPKWFQKLPQYEVWKDIVTTQNLCEEVLPFDEVKVLKYFLKNQGAWSQFIGLVLDETGTKDERIVLLAKSAMIPLPLEKRSYQSMNGHFVLLTNSKTGKTKTIYFATGQEGATRYTLAGLVGGILNGVVMKSPFEGTGCYFFDELTRLNTNRTEDTLRIGEILLDILESGRTHSQLVQSVEVITTKLCIFCGNNDTEYGETDLFRKIGILFDSDSLEKAGRRFVMFYIPNMRHFRTSKLPSDIEEYKVRGSRVIQGIIDKNIGVIDRFRFVMVDKYISPDSRFEREIRMMSKGFKRKEMVSFYVGQSYATERMQFIALNATLIDNIDRIIAGTVKPSMLKDEFLCHYEKVKDMVRTSISVCLDEGTTYQEWLAIVREHQIDLNSNFTNNAIKWFENKGINRNLAWRFKQRFLGNVSVSSQASELDEVDLR